MLPELLIRKKTDPKSSARHHDLKVTLSSVQVNEPVINLSPTSYLLYKHCPAGFYFRYILGVNDQDFSPLIRKPENESAPDLRAVFGTICHKLFEQLLPGKIPAVEDARFYAGQEILDPMRAQEFAELAFEHMKKLAESEYGNRLLKNKKQYIELPFQMYCKGAWINGFIDRLYYDETDRAWVVLDYKTNKLTPADIDKKVVETGYDIQLQFYALAISRMLMGNASSIKTHLFFTTPGTLWEQIVTKSMMKKLETSIGKVTEQIQKGVFVATPSDAEKCNLCLFHEHNFCAGDGAIYHANAGYRYTVLK
jgi:RecB family exonuclease